MVNNPGKTEAQRFWEKVEITESCWLWIAQKGHNGYGHFGANNKDGKMNTVRVHRYVYEHLVGPIPDGLDIDHLCRVRHCVNPEHLEPVTRRENTMRGENFIPRHAAKTTCPRGHIYTRVDSRGGRMCRPCATVAARASRARKKPLP